MELSLEHDVALKIHDKAEAKAMLYYSLVFLVIALIAGAFGFGGLAATSAGIARILFGIFLILFIVSLVMQVVGRS
jgi:uncharacterized membrane protein YtjA (UPF0391 family)